MAGIDLTSAQYVDFGDIAALASLDAMSVLITLTPSGAPSNGERIVTQWGATSPAFVIQVEANGTIEFGVVSESTGFFKGRQTSASGYVVDGVPVRLGFSISDDQTMNIWVDGVNVATAEWVTNNNFTELKNSSHLVCVGYEPDEALDGVAGQYSEFAIFDAQLADTDFEDYGDGIATPDELAGVADGIVYVPMLTSGDMTDLFDSNTVTNHGGTWAGGGPVIPVFMNQYRQRRA